MPLPHLALLPTSAWWPGSQFPHPPPISLAASGLWDTWCCDALIKALGAGLCRSQVVFGRTVGAEWVEGRAQPYLLPLQVSFMAVMKA